MRSNSCPRIALGKITYFCCKEGSTRGTETSWVPGDPNFSIARVKRKVVWSLLSKSLLINSNSLVITFCVSDGCTRLSDNNSLPAICSDLCDAQAANRPIFETEHTTWILPDELCGSQAGEQPYPAVRQPAGLEKKNSTRAYERPVHYF